VGQAPKKEAGPPTKKDGKTQDELVAETERLLKTRIHIGFHKESIPFVQLLEELRKHMPKDVKMSFRIEESAFGQDLAEVLKAPIKPGIPEEMRKNPFSLEVLLRLAVFQLVPEADYRVEPGQVVITTPERAAYTKPYDVGDLVQTGKRLFVAVDRWYAE